MRFGLSLDIGLFAGQRVALLSARTDDRQRTFPDAARRTFIGMSIETRIIFPCTLEFDGQVHRQSTNLRRTVPYVVFEAQAATLSFLFRPCKVVVCMEPSDS